MVLRSGPKLITPFRNKVVPFRGTPFSKPASGGGAASPYLDGVIDSVCCDLDATIADSYDGSSQTWANLIANPADSAAQTDYDAWLGSTSAVQSNDPSFVGTAGDQAAYFNSDGAADRLTFKTQPDTIKNWGDPATGGPVWVAMALKFASTLNSDGTLFGNASAASGESGMYLRHGNGNGSIQLIQRTGSGENSADSGRDISAGTDYVIVVTWDPTTDVADFYISGEQDSNQTLTFGSIVNSAGLDHTILARGGNNQMEIGTRLYSLAVGNELIDSAQAAAIIAHLEARHGRDYTP